MLSYANKNPKISSNAWEISKEASTSRSLFWVVSRPCFPAAIHLQGFCNSRAECGRSTKRKTSHHFEYQDLFALWWVHISACRQSIGIIIFIRLLADTTSQDGKTDGNFRPFLLLNLNAKKGKSFSVQQSTDLIQKRAGKQGNWFRFQLGDRCCCWLRLTSKKNGSRDAWFIYRTFDGSSLHG